MVDRRRQVQSLLIGKSFKRRAFYFLIFVLACMTLFDVTSLTLEYAGNPKQANMNVIFNESMTYPNITFCMSRRQAWSHFGVDTQNKAKMERAEQWRPEIEAALANFTDKTSFMRENWPSDLVMSGYEAIATLNSLERESVAQQAMRDIETFGDSPKKAKLRTLVKKWLKTIDERNVTFMEFTSKIGFETLKRSLRRFERTSFNESDEFHMKPRISWLSSKQLCFQPVFLDEDSFKPIEDQGDIFVLTLVHDNKTLAGGDKTAIECMSVDFHGRPTTMARNMEGKGRVKDGTTEQLCIGDFHEVTVEVRAHYTMLENDEKATACRNYDDVDDAEVNEFDCRSRCRMEMIRQACHCTPLTLQYLSDDTDMERYPVCDYEKCNIAENATFTDQLCAQHCLPHCVQTRYTITAVKMGTSQNTQITKITLLWGAFEYLDLEQKYVWSLWTFIAAIGGSIGMWLGLSALSLIQLITFLTERTAQKVTVKAKKSRVAATLHPNKGARNTGTASAGMRKTSGSDSDSKLSLNPFGGPVAINPFESPFGNKKDEDAASKTSKGGKVSVTGASNQPMPGKEMNETEFHTRAASP